MNTRLLKDKVTVVIPSKNEGMVLYNCIMYLSHQNEIDNTKIIISDISDNEESLKYIEKIKIDFKDTLNINVIKGGYPSYGRLEGSKLVKTPYMLFMDADIYLTKTNILIECIKHKKDLVTVPFHTDYPYRWVFRMFDIFQWVSILLRTPFAVGGFQLWNTKTYWELGGYNPNELFAEDYSLSKKVKPKELKIVNIGGVYTSSRRFKSKGVLWMFKVLIKSFFNRNNSEFFKKSQGYWN